MTGSLSKVNANGSFDRDNDVFEFEGPKIELWNLHYNKKQNWINYKSEQREEKYDIILITNHQKNIKYILNDVIINCILCGTP